MISNLFNEKNINFKYLRNTNSDHFDLKDSSWL